MENLLTIKDYANLKGQTQQAIYKSIANGKLKVKIIGGKKYIKVKQAQAHNQKINNATGNELTNELVQTLKDQLQEKDKQINQLMLLNANLQTQLDNTKQLTYKKQNIFDKLFKKQEHNTNEN